MGRRFGIVLLLFEVVLCSLYSKICILVLPFEKFSGVFGVLMARGESRSSLEPVCRVSEIFKNIERVSRYLPWETLCLVKAHTAALMLRRRRQPFYALFGVKKSSSNASPINAHAWIEINDSLSFGKEKQESFGIIASYFYSRSK